MTINISKALNDFRLKVWTAGLRKTWLLFLLLSHLTFSERDITFALKNQVIIHHLLWTQICSSVSRRRGNAYKVVLCSMSRLKCSDIVVPSRGRVIIFKRWSPLDNNNALQIRDTVASWIVDWVRCANDLPRRQIGWRCWCYCNTRWRDSRFEPTDHLLQGIVPTLLKLIVGKRRTKWQHQFTVNKLDGQHVPTWRPTCTS